MAHSNTIVNVSKSSTYLSMSKEKRSNKSHKLINWHLLNLVSNNINLMNNKHISDRRESTYKSYLIKVKFDIYQWHPLTHLTVVFDYSVDGLRDILEYQVKIEFIFFSC